MTMSITVQRFLPVALTAALISACADAPTSTVSFAPSQPDQHVVPVATPELELLTLCKAGPVGTYTFNATSTHPYLRDVAAGTNSLTAATYTIVVSAGSTIDVGGNVVPGACVNWSNATGNHNHIAVASGGIDVTVTVTETGIPPLVNFDHVVVYQRTAGTVTSSSSTTNLATAHLGGNASGNLGAGILFYNVATPVDHCGYTKGWYRNKNGSPTVIAVDGRSIAEAQAIFAATPGKPGGVTWGANNNNLNLYQQLLAALQNLDGDPLGGPAAVDQAIAAALAGTSGTGLNIIVAPGTDVSGLINTLSSFNEGKFAGFPHCTDEVLPV
jgi:hypothetical protein